jgi:hypothetical protein
VVNGLEIPRLDAPRIDVPRQICRKACSVSARCVGFGLASASNSFSCIKHSRLRASPQLLIQLLIQLLSQDSRPRFSPKILIWADKIRTKDCTGQWPLFSKLTSISPLPAIG